MAHGPVNKAWYLSPVEGMRYKIPESDYQTIRTKAIGPVIGVEIGQRTDRTVYLWDAKEFLESNGYELKESGVFGKLSGVDYDFSA